MFRKFFKTTAAVMLITSMTVMTVFADDVSDLNKKKQQAQNEVDQLQNELSYLLVQCRWMTLRHRWLNQQPG